MKTIICHAVENTCPRSYAIYEDCQATAEYINKKMGDAGWIDRDNAEREISECDESIKKHLEIYEYEVKIDE